MCGIGGILGNPDSSLLYDINRMQKHRGPDDSAIWIDENCGLSHTRLSILDLSGSGQPIESNYGSVLVANGEIYNYRDLNKASYPYRTKGDSESILALHHSFAGSSAETHAQWISQLNGMFAFAIWDSKNNQLILARDTMGIKPLNRTIVNGSLMFASEYKAFRVHELYNPEIDFLALRARLAWEYPLDGTSLLKNVSQVRPGTVETWSLIDGVPLMTGIAFFENENIVPTKSWSKPELLLESFVTSVQERLMADVPVGIVLSGGLDSSLLAAVAHEASERASQPLPSCWTVAESEDNPDWQAAELVASEMDLEHHQHLIPDDIFNRKLGEMSWYGEDLDVTVLFFQPLFEAMSTDVTVGLCGQGADELHAGYSRYQDLAKHGTLVQSRLDKMETDLSNLRGSEWWLGNHNPNQHTKSLQDFLQFELRHGQLSNFQLRLVDRHSMSHGLEVRVPFLGRSHRQIANRLPMNWRLHPKMNEKVALRKAASLTKLPDSIVNRPKLPAGRATSPRIIDEFLLEMKPRAVEIANQSGDIQPVLLESPEIAIGYGLFQAVHLLGEGESFCKRNVIDLLDEVIK